MHTYRICDRGSRIRGDRGAAGADGASPAGVRDDPAQGPVDTSTEQQPAGKPRCTSYYFKFMTPIYVSIICALGLGIVWNPSCMIPMIL